MNIFTKMRQSLLFAALLCAGGTFAQEAEYGVVWSQDFENAGTYTEGWTLGGSKQNTFNGSAYLHLYGVNASTSFASNEDFTTAEDYKFEFDWNAGQGNGNAKIFTMTVASDNAEGKLCYVNVGASGGWSSAAVVCDATGNSLVETTVDGYRKDAAFTFMFHFLIEGNSEGVALTITKSDGSTVLEKTKISDALCHVTGLSATYSSASCMGFDNLILSVAGASEGITAPSCSITGTYENTRTVTIVAGVGTEGTQASGTYYTTDGTEPTNESALYEGPFTISESCTIKVISYLPDGTASEIFEFAAEAGTVWPLNADVVKVSGLVGEESVKNPVIDNSYINDGVLGSPEVSFSYTFNGEEVTLPYTVTENGTLVATASADGYASATETLELKANYLPTRSVDFTTITGENVSSLGDTWTYSDAAQGRWAWWADGSYYHANPNSKTLTDFLRASENCVLIIGFGVGRNTTSQNTTFSITDAKEDEIAIYVVDESYNKNAQSKALEYMYAYVDDPTMSHVVSKIPATVAKVTVYSPVRELTVTDGVDLDASGTYTSASYVRKFNTEYTYGTICLPFAPDAATCANYTFYKLAEVNSEALIFEEEAAPKANTAYLYKLNDGVDAETAKTFTGGVTTISDVEVESVGGWNFIGSFAKTEITDLTGGDYWAYQAEYNGKKDVLVKAGTKLVAHPYRAYFKFVPTEELNFTPAAATMRMIIGGKEGGAMEIQEVIAPEQVEGAAFDLEGRPVENMQKGQIYIIGGKKVKK